jgi:hypothetical protein
MPDDSRSTWVGPILPYVIWASSDQHRLGSRSFGITALQDASFQFAALGSAICCFSSTAKSM